MVSIDGKPPSDHVLEQLGLLYGKMFKITKIAGRVGRPPKSEKADTAPTSPLSPEPTAEADVQPEPASALLPNGGTEPPVSQDVVDLGAEEPPAEIESPAPPKAAKKPSKKSKK